MDWREACSACKLAESCFGSSAPRPSSQRSASVRAARCQTLPGGGGQRNVSHRVKRYTTVDRLHPHIKLLFCLLHRSNKKHVNWWVLEVLVWVSSDMRDMFSSFGESEKATNYYFEILLSTLILKINRLKIMFAEVFTFLCTHSIKSIYKNIIITEIRIRLGIHTINDVFFSMGELQKALQPLDICFCSLTWLIIKAWNVNPKANSRYKNSIMMPSRVLRISPNITT